jgi:hypothetical protein
LVPSSEIPERHNADAPIVARISIARLQLRSSALSG